MESSQIGIPLPKMNKLIFLFFALKVMKRLIIFLFCISVAIPITAQSQKETSEAESHLLKPPSSAIVQEHKDNLKLTLIVDSIILGQRRIIPNFQITIPITFESDYIQVKDSLYLKIFISRNQEYGRKFYSWKWDFLKKINNHFYSKGVSNYEIMDFNGNLNPNGSEGHGVGIEGTKDFVMYYYRYRLE